MQPKLNYIFDLPAGFGLDELRGLISGNQIPIEDPLFNVQRQYLDTFDWRLFAHGSVLELARDSNGQGLIWRSVGSGEVLLQQRMPQVPHFASDFTAPAIRARLEAITGVRAMHPKVALDSEVRGLRLVDDEGKTMVRLELRRDQILLPQSTKQISLPQRLYLFPYRGYAKAAAKLQRALGGKRGLRPAREDPLASALHALGLQAGEYSSQLRYAISPGMAGSHAVARVHLQLLEHLQTNLDGACRDLDSEFLHDLRAAASRAELLLSKLPGAFPGVDTRRYLEEFAWLEKVSRPTRQLDVYLMLLEEYKSRLPPGQDSYLEPFRSFLRDHKLSEHRDLNVALRSPRYHRLVEGWRKLLEHQLARPEDPAEAPVETLAAGLVGPAYEALVTQGRKISDNTPAAPLIELHKACKELQYLLEFFHPLCQKKRLNQVKRRLDRLEDNLETFEDLELQQQRLRRFIAEMRAEQRLVQQTALEAMDLLISDMADREVKVRKGFAKRFAKFSDDESQTRMQALFSPPAGLQPETP